MSMQTRGHDRTSQSPLTAVWRKAKRPPAGGLSLIWERSKNSDYLSWSETLLKLVFSLVPIVFTTAMIATEIPAAIRPYSIAVAPDSFFRKERIFDMRRAPLGLTFTERLCHPEMKGFLAATLKPEGMTAAQGRGGWAHSGREGHEWGAPPAIKMDLTPLSLRRIRISPMPYGYQFIDGFL